MTAPILVTGGTGTLGRAVVARLRDAGAQIRVLSRSRTGTQDGIRYLTGDLSTGTGLEAAVDGVGTIVHCASARTGDAEATRNLVAAAANAGAPHLVYVSIVGVDRLPWGYMKTKLDSERIVEQSGLPWTILRATQFFQLIQRGAQALSRPPVIPVPVHFPVQPIDPDEVAARLADLALGRPAGRVPDLGGPQVLPFTDVIRIYLKVTRRRRWILPLWLPGLRAVRAGALLPEPRTGSHQPTGHTTWEEFVTGTVRSRPPATAG
jgi:uncharacterized protein YbjT (DUF2867 family)